MKTLFVSVVSLGLGFSAVALGDACVEQCKREARQDNGFCQAQLDECRASFPDVHSSACDQDYKRCMTLVSPGFQACVAQCNWGDFPVFVEK